MDNKNEDEKNSKQEFKVLIMDVKDEEFEEFQNTINKELIIDLYSVFRIFEKNGIINYDIYIEAMTEVFKKYNKSKDFKYIFNLIFNRFQKIKCTLKNNKTVFYLTDMIYKNAIETYIIPCFLTLLLKCSINDKIKLLFQLTDNDEDGFLNKAEIKLMISTVNFFFCENSENDINSSIITQSLMNIKVKEQLKKLMIDPGGLGYILEKEKVVNFDDFFKCLEKIDNYKYEIIPCFLNIKKCLYNQRKEKIIEVKNKNKKEFVRISSALSSRNLSEQFKSYKSQRNYSANLEKLIKVIKTSKEDEVNKNDNIYNNLIKKNNLLLGIKENNKSFKELLKKRTVFTDKENEEYITSSSSRRAKRPNQYRKKLINSEYIFVADFDKIKKLEVEPALLKFAKDNCSINKIKKNNSNYNIFNPNKEKKNIFKKVVHKKTFDFKKNIYQRNIQSAKNYQKKTQKINFFRRRSYFPLNNKDDNLKNSNQNFKFLSNQNVSSKNMTFSKGSLDKIFERKKNMEKANKNNFRKINNINVYKQKFNRFNRFKAKKLFNIKSRNDSNKLSSLSESSKNKQNLPIKNLKNLTFDKLNPSQNKSSLNQTLFRTQNIKKEINNIKKYAYLGSRFTRYLNIQEILEDLAEEKRITKGKTYCLEKELALIYQKLEKERLDLDEIKFHDDDFSFHFFASNEKLFPNAHGKKRNFFIKIK